MKESPLVGDSDIKEESGKVTFQWGPQGGPNVEARPASHPQAQGAKEDEEDSSGGPLGPERTGLGAPCTLFCQALLISFHLFKSARS